MMLLQNKLSDVKNCGPIWKVKEKPQLLKIISKLINGMTELESLASKHSIEDQLYHHSYISMVFDLIGDQRREKFAYKYAGETMTCKVKWQKIREYLSKETKVLEDLIIDERARQCKHPDEDLQKPKEKPKDKQKPVDHNQLVNASSTGKVTCVICGSDDHVSSPSKSGQELVHYIACETWSKKTPAERFQLLKDKDLCFQCLYPGKKNNHDGPCFSQYACKHPSHKRYNKSKHVLVCEDHKDDDENQELFEKYKKRFITSSKVKYKDFTQDLKLSFYAQVYAGIVQQEDESAIFMLQTIMVTGEGGASKDLNLLWDNGCLSAVPRKGAVDELESIGRARNVKEGPLTIIGVGGVESVCPHGAYEVTLTQYDGKELTISGLCMETVTGKIPEYPLQEVERDVHEEYRRRGKNPDRLPKLPASVGGETDLIIGVQYLKYFPREVFELPCGLRIYESKFLNADGTRGVVAGNHRVFTELQKKLYGTHVSLHSYCSQQLSLFKQGYKISLDVPLLGDNKPFRDVDTVTEGTTFEEEDRLLEYLEAPIEEKPSSHVQNDVHHSTAINDFVQLDIAGTASAHCCDKCWKCECQVYLRRRTVKQLDKKFDESQGAGGIDVSYWCVECRDCPDCKVSGQDEEISVREEVERDVINRSVEVDLTECETKADLPRLKDAIGRLFSNKGIALKVLWFYLVLFGSIWFYVNTKVMIADLGTRKGAKIQDVIPISPWIDEYEWMKFDRENSAIKSITEVKMSAREKKQFDQECMDPEDKLGSTEPIFGFGNCLYALIDSAFGTDVVSAKKLSERYKFCNYVIDPNRFRFREVVRALAMVLLFIRRIKARLADGKCVPAIPKEPPTIKTPAAVNFQDDQYLVTQGLCCNASSRYLSSLTCIKECSSQFAYGLVGETHGHKTDEMNSGVGTVLRYTQNIAYVLGGRELVKKYRKNSIQSNCDIFQAWFESWIVSLVPTLIQQPKWFKLDEDVRTGDIILFLQPDKPFEKQYQYRLVKYVAIGRDGKIREIEIEYQNHDEALQRCTCQVVREIVVIHQVEEIGIELELNAIARHRFTRR